MTKLLVQLARNLNCLVGKLLRTRRTACQFGCQLSDRFLSLVSWSGLVPHVPYLKIPVIRIIRLVLVCQSAKVESAKVFIGSLKCLVGEW